MAQIAKQQHLPTTLNDHIRELRMRLFVSVIALLISGIVVYFFYGPILTLLSAPLGAPLYYNSPAGSFSFVMKICFMGALIITIPVLAYNLIMFVRPAFEQALSLKRVYLTTIFSTILAMTGAIFAYTIILPGALKFFAGFQVSGLSALISADNYLGFVTNIIITFVLVFQIPLIITFIDIVKPLGPKKLLKIEKWVILGSLIIALLVPFTYDLVTSLLIALPMIVLYNLSIVIVVMRHANVAHKNRIIIRATIAKPNLYPVPESELSLNELLLESFTDELINLEKIKPNTTVVKSNRAGIDIRPSVYEPEPVSPAAWVQERKSRQIALSAHVRVFSDIVRVPRRTNRALASQ